MREAEHYESFRFHMKRLWIFLENLRDFAVSHVISLNSQDEMEERRQKRVRERRKSMRIDLISVSSCQRS